MTLYVWIYRIWALVLGIGFPLLLFFFPPAEADFGAITIAYIVAALIGAVIFLYLYFEKSDLAPMATAYHLQENTLQLKFIKDNGQNYVENIELSSLAAIDAGLRRIDRENEKTNGHPVLRIILYGTGEHNRQILFQFSAHFAPWINDEPQVLERFQELTDAVNAAIARTRAISFEQVQADRQQRMEQENVKVV